mmetsp:Transcript_15664/g.31940  ORF Transcript_15664/g.31940 Transcript_15664/m.31940 type:complete len:720 (+) Transcript_15664:236-2395(+)
MDPMDTNDSVPPLRNTVDDSTNNDVHTHVKTHINVNKVPKGVNKVPEGEIKGENNTLGTQNNTQPTPMKTESTPTTITNPVNTSKPTSSINTNVPTASVPTASVTTAQPSDSIVSSSMSSQKHSQQQQQQQPPAAAAPSSSSSKPSATPAPVSTDNNTTAAAATATTTTTNTHTKATTKDAKDVKENSNNSDDDDVLVPPINITSDEVNFLVYRYLQESGFVHSSFTFAYESLLTKSSTVNAPLPPGALITFLQKGLQYLAIEEHLTPEGGEKLCDGDFGLLSPNTCEALMGGGQAGVGVGGVDNYPTETEVAEAQQAAARQAPPPLPPAVDDDSTAVSLGSYVTLSRHTSEVFMCSWNPVRTNLIATGSGDATARIWTMGGPTAAHGFTGSVTLKHGDYLGDKNKDVTTLEWSPDGARLATGSYDGVARVWDAEGNIVYTLQLHKGPIFSLKWNKSGTYLLSGSYDKTTIAWDMKTGTVHQQFTFHGAPALDVDWNGDDVFASCSTDKTVVVCKVKGGAGSPPSPWDSQPVVKFEGHDDEVNAVKWSPDGALLASCSDDGTAKIWSYDASAVTSAPAPAGSQPAKPLQDLTLHTKEIYTIKWSPTGPGSPNPSKPLLLATASFDNTVRLWSAATGACIHTLRRHTQPVYSISFSPSASHLASGSLAGKLYVWSVDAGEVVCSYTGKGDIFEVAWNREETRVAACFSSNAITVVDFKGK